MDVTQSAAARALGDLVASFHVEASRNPDSKGILIRDQADALDGIRIRNLRGELPDDDALAWLDSGRRVLADLVMQRCLTGSPMLRDIHDRLADG